ncbi:MAG: GNAT family N-acetyltransferase [Planctomycetaceae bacterium]
MPPDIACRRVAVEEILPLRHRILRAGLPFETASFEGDHDATTRHHAAFRGAEPVGCLSLVESVWEGRPAWQLRGMAIDADMQGRGMGRLLLETALAEALHDEPGRIFWCNARTSAIGFYERAGWRVVSDEFEVPTAGPHVKMLRDGVGMADARPTPAGSSAASFIAAELAFLVSAQILGGPPWVALGGLAFAGQAAACLRLRPLVGLAPAVAWMTAHRLTGNRELFFPYAMALAAHLAGQFVVRGRMVAGVAGGLIVTAFLAIRALQAATVPVLAVESAVAAVILTVAVPVLPAVANRPWGAAFVAAAASLLACAGLAL